jgi:hypothetical protein
VKPLLYQLLFGALCFSTTWLKNKKKIVNAFESGNNRSTQKLKSSSYENLDKAVYKWFVKVRDEGLPVNGPILKEKAIKYAEELGIENFKASNGWFERWKGRHEISFKTVSGEAKSCTEEMTASWENRLFQLFSQTMSFETYTTQMNLASFIKHFLVMQ